MSEREFLNEQQCVPPSLICDDCGGQGMKYGHRKCKTCNGTGSLRTDKGRK